MTQLQVITQIRLHGFFFYMFAPVVVSCVTFPPPPVYATQLFVTSVTKSHFLMPMIQIYLKSFRYTITSRYLLCEFAHAH